MMMGLGWKLTCFSFELDFGSRCPVRLSASFVQLSRVCAAKSEPVLKRGEAGVLFIWF